MKKLIIAAAMAAGLLVSPPAEVSAENISIGTGTYNFTREVDREIAPGVRYTYFKAAGRNGSNSYASCGTHVFVTEVDLTNPNVKIEYYTASGTTGGTRKSMAAIASANTTTNHKVVAGANANFWITSEQPWKSQMSLEPHGTAIHDGQPYVQNATGGYGSHIGGPSQTGMIAITADGRAKINYYTPKLEFLNTRINHVLDIRDFNRTVTEGSAVVYTPAWGRSKAFKPVKLNSDNTWSIVTGQCTEVYLSLAPGETAKVGGTGTTKYIVKEVRANAGTGTLGNYDLCIVGQDITGAPYAAVLAGNYRVGDELVFTNQFYTNGAAWPIIEEATSGNCLAMVAGTVIGPKDGPVDQTGYNANVYARTLYATNNDGTKLWIAVCGHKASTYYGLTTSQMAYFLKALGATYAGQVDGGGSSQMYVDGSQVNQSTDTGGTRLVHSGIFVVSTGNEVVQNPSLTTTATNSDFGTVNVGGSAEKQFTVTGANLTGDINISISGTNATQFVVTPSTILKANQSGTITVKYAPTAEGSHTATLNIATSGVATKTFTLTGKAEMIAGASSNYPDDAKAYGVNASSSYTLEREYQDYAISELSGKTIKRVIARGDILYILAHDSSQNPTIVVFNHTTKQVLRTLGTENATIGTPRISDIAISADGILVGQGYATQKFSNKGDGSDVDQNGLTYYWLNGSDGTAYGQPFHWNRHFNGGNYSNALIGESVAMSGEKNTGRFINTATTCSAAGVISGGATRFTIQQLGYVYTDGQIKDIWHNNLNSVSGWTKPDLGDILLFVSPFNDNNVILQGNKKNGAEFSLSGTKAGVPSKVADLPSIIPAAANHTGIFRYGGKIYMTSPTFSGSNNNGIMLVDITDGLASGTQVSLSKSSMNSAATTNVATVGTGVITMEGGKFVEARMAILAVRNGAVTKFITPSSIVTPEPEDPELITTAANTNFGEVEIGKTGVRAFNVEGSGLKGDVTFTVSGAGFSVTPAKMSKDEADGSVQIIFTPTEEDEYSGTLTISTPGIDPVTITLKGTGIAPIVYSNRAHHPYNLKHTFHPEDGYTFHFHSTGDAANARIRFTRVDGVNKVPGKMKVVASEADNTVDERVYEVGAVSKGENTVTIPHDWFPHAQYNWTVELENNPVENGGLVFQVNAPKTNSSGGVVVIDDPESPMYGYIVTGNGYAQGFSVYTPEHQLVGNYNADYYSNHGARPAWDVDNQFSIGRLAQHNGIVYATDYSDAGAGIYIFNPEHPEYGTGNIFQGTKDEGGCWFLNGTALGGGGTGIAFTGTGANTQLWSFQCDYPSGNATPQILVRWNVGNSTSISAAPVATYSNVAKDKNFLNGNVNIYPDGDRGVFVSQVRGNGNSSHSCPGFVYMNYDGEFLYNAGDHSDIIPASGSGIALNADRTKLAVSMGKLGIRVFDVTWDANGAPSLTNGYDIPGSTSTIDQVPQMAFDPAGNVLAYQISTTASKGGLNIYALPQSRGTIVTATAPMSYIVDGTATGVEDITLGDGEPEAEPVYYDIKGVQVDGKALIPGLYLKVTGKKVEKVRVK